MEPAGTYTRLAAQLYRYHCPMSEIGLFPYMQPVNPVAIPISRHELPSLASVKSRTPLHSAHDKHVSLVHRITKVIRCSGKAEALVVTVPLLVCVRLDPDLPRARVPFPTPL